MSIRWKVAIIIAAIFLALEGVNIGIQKFVMLPGFLSLEREEAVKDAKRVEDAIEREINYLDTLNHDWASWDDTYDFVLDVNDEYIETNLIPSVFEDNHLDLICFYSTERKLVWRGTADVPESSKEVLGNLFKESFPENHPVFANSAIPRPPQDLFVSGVLQTEIGPMLISSRPILTSNNEGPARGYLILGYFLDESFSEKIAGQTHVDFNLYPFSKDAMPDSTSEVTMVKEGGKSYTIDPGKGVSVLKIYTTFQDIEGQNAFLIEAGIERKIYAKGANTMQYAVALLVISGLIALAVLVLLIQRTVLNPLGDLTTSIIAAKRKEFDSLISFSNRRDEIGILSREFEDMLSQLRNRSLRLEELNAALMDDIGKRKKAENALRESEERFKTLLENLPVGVFVHDLEENILLVNDVACSDSGYRRDELLSKSLRDINPETFTDEEHGRLWKKVRNGESVAVETMNVKKDGTEYPVEVHLTRIALEGKPIVLAIVFDITERKRAEAALRESEEKLLRSKKMESLGLLAGGVAHDLNNVLSGIVSYPELIMLDLPKDSKLIDPLKTMQTSGLRAVAIVQDLLTVARGVAVEKHSLNLNRIVTQYLESPENSKLLFYHKNVVIKTDLDPLLLNIKGATVHIGKTLMNLVSNAAEAMETGGEIIIRTENRYLDRPLRGYEEVTVGEYAVLTVKDTGSGISAKDLERIFEPFYTKKVMGRSGTGLGLSIVWNVLQEHKGYIDVASDSGGSTFSLYFPITREEVKAHDKSFSLKDCSGNGQKILVVDDVESQREIFCNMLKILGYDATAVCGGEEAVEYLKENKVDLVVLDMIMDPGINGRETYQRILKLHPGQKAIIASGFAETDDVRIAQRLGAGQFIKKPVQLEKMGLAIKAELSR